MGVSTWIGNTGNWSSAGNWNTGVPTASDDVYIADGDPQVTADVGTVGMVYDGADLTIDDGGALTTGTIINTGTLNVFANTGRLSVNGAIENSGVFSIISSSPVAVSATSLSNSGSISVTGTMTVADAAGFGTLGTVTGHLTEYGTLQFGSGGLTTIASGASLDLGGEINIAGQPGSNSALNGLSDVAGLLTVETGSHLNISGDLGVEGTIAFEGGALATGGTLTFHSGSQVYWLGSGTADVGALQLDQGSAVSFDDPFGSPARSLTAHDGVSSISGNVSGTGTLAFDGGTSVINADAAVTTPTVALGGSAFLEIAGPASTITSAIVFQPGASATLQIDAAALPATGGTFSNPIVLATYADTIDLRGLAFASGATALYDSSNASLAVTSNGVVDHLTLAVPDSTVFDAVDDGQGGTRIVVVCFAAGTLIRTDRGECPVEDLVIGDTVVTSTGAKRPVRWIGHRMLRCRTYADPRDVMPIRITANAFGDGLPSRDLHVSPGHAICVSVVGEILVPASALVNGATITQVDVDTITYWHVELDSHDILFANGLPTESYADVGNRSFFLESEAIALDAVPDASPETPAAYCRPFKREGLLVDAVREQLRARARDIGWSLRDSTLADLHVVADGAVVMPSINGLAARFLLPAGAKDVWLVSSATVPAHVMTSDDQRVLGIYVAGLTADDGLAVRRTIAIDDPLLCDGFHGVERNAEGLGRWTTGRARLPAHLWEGCQGQFFLRVDLARAALPRWEAPANGFALPGTTVANRSFG